MGKFIDLTGQRFGRWTVIKRAEIEKKSPKDDVKWLCVCDCGTQKIVKGASLKAGLSTSCGCYKIEYQRQQMRKRHKENPQEIVRTKEKLHNAWKSMIQRCYNKNHKYYCYYGERGITVCDSWKQDYLSFRKWALENGWHDGLTIDRIDNDKNYCPENCRFATKKQQANNRRNNRYVEICGERLTMAEWADRLNVTHARIWHYVDKGYTGLELCEKLGVRPG